MKDLCQSNFSTNKDDIIYPSIMGIHIHVYFIKTNIHTHPTSCSKKGQTVLDLGHLTS